MKSVRENPTAGLVVRYDYLWKQEFLSQKIEGAKNRPCAVVVPMKVSAEGTLRVILAAITHSPPHNSQDAIEIPAFAERAIGLDDLPSWIVVNEVNIVDWADAGFVPATVDSWNYGFLPKHVMNKMIQEISSRAKAGSLFKVSRE
jgi:hypothetical protein